MNPKLKPILCFVFIVLTLPAHADVLDFEQVYGAPPFEGLAISNQFAARFGMRFIDLDEAYFPIIVQKGSPARVFDSPGGGDTLSATNPYDHGQFFLADPGVDVERGPKGLIIQFEAPISTFGCYILDLDSDEKVTLTAFASTNASAPLAINVVYSTNAPFGEGLSGPISISTSGKVIRRIELKAQGRSGFPKLGFDNFSSDYVAPPQDGAVLAAKLCPGLTINGTIGTPYRLDYADSLDRTMATTNWHTLTNLYLINSPYFYVDTTATNSPNRFYRAIGTQ